VGTLGVHGHAVARELRGLVVESGSRASIGGVKVEYKLLWWVTRLFSPHPKLDEHMPVVRYV
jgi:hypothetical protein